MAIQLFLIKLCLGFFSSFSCRKSIILNNTFSLFSFHLPSSHQKKGKRDLWEKQNHFAFGLISFFKDWFLLLVETQRKLVWKRKILFSLSYRDAAWQNNFWQSSCWGLKGCQTHPFHETGVPEHPCVPGAASQGGFQVHWCCVVDLPEITISIPAVGLQWAPLICPKDTQKGGNWDLWYLWQRT